MRAKGMRTTAWMDGTWRAGGGAMGTSLRAQVMELATVRAMEDLGNSTTKSPPTLGLNAW